MYKHFFKRIIDFCIAFVVLSGLALPLVIVTLWLHFANKGAGAFFFQERPGKDGKIFKIVKSKNRRKKLRLFFVIDITGKIL